MSTLLNIYPGDGFAHHLFTFLLQSCLLVVLGLIGANYFTRNAASRYTILLAISLAVLILPFAALAVQQAGLSLFASPYILTPPSEGEFVNVNITSQKPIPASNTSPIHARPDTSIPQPALAAANTPQPSTPSTITNQDRVRAALSTLFLAWIGGALLLGIRLLSSLLKLHRLYHATTSTGRQVHSIARAIAQELGLKTVPPVGISSHINCPGVIGYARPKIVIPKPMATRLNDVQWRQILLHEMAHIHRKDQWMVLLQKCLHIVLWPHPILPLLNTQLLKAQEEICDNYVLASTDGAVYSRTLVDVAEAIPANGFPSASVGLFHNRYPLQERVTQLINHRRQIMQKTNFKTLATIAIGTLVITAALSLTHPAWGIDPEIKIRILEEKAEVKELLREGKISKLEAKIRIAEIKLEAYEDALGEEVEENHIDPEERLDRYAEELEEAVRQGEMSREEAKEKFEAAERELHEHMEHDERMAKYHHIEAELHEMVEAGEISREEAEEKLIAMRRRLLVDERHERHERFEAHLEEIGRRLKHAVEEGEISEDEAKQKYEAAERKMFKRARIGDSLEWQQQEIETHLDRTWEKLQFLVRTGEISEEEARVKMARVKEEAQAKMADMKEEAARKMRDHDEDEWEEKQEGIDAHLEEVWHNLLELVEKGKLAEEDAHEMMGVLKKRIHR